MNRDFIKQVKDLIPPAKVDYYDTDEKVLEYYEKHKSILEPLITKEVTLEDVMLDFIESLPSKYWNELMLKGCMALKAKIPNIDEMRLTRDIDLTVCSIDAWERFLNNGCIEASENSDLGYKYHIDARKGLSPDGISDSIKIRYITESGESSYFKLDVNIRQDELSFREDTKLRNSNICTYSIEGILADKLRVFSTNKICRRIKDMLDIYYVACRLDFRNHIIAVAMQEKFPNISEDILSDKIFSYEPENVDKLRHAYEKYQIVSKKKPSFEEVYTVSVNFSKEIYLALIGKTNLKKWRGDAREWVEV